MERRKRKHLVDPQIVFGLLIAVGVLWLFVHLLQQPGIGIVISVVLVAALAYPVVRHFRRVNASRTLLQKAETAIEQQMSALIRRRAQLIWEDAYGRPQVEKWAKEIDYFIMHNVVPVLAPNECVALERERPMVAHLIEERVEAAMQAQPAFRDFSDDMTPGEFERFCAEELRRVGWNARVTLQSRDQGVDVVAEKDGVRVVFQCKLYARPVGNKAVQEAAAAKAHEQASYGAVVTNNRYTQAAEQLASTNEILLLHYRDLPNLENILLTEKRCGADGQCQGAVTDLYPDPRRDEWQTKTLPALKQLPLSRLIKESVLSRRALLDIRKGRSRLHPRNQERLAAIVCDSG